MFGRDTSGLVSDIENLQIEAADVLQAIELLDAQIYEDINEHRLNEGEFVRTKVLDELNSNQRHRVINNFVDRFYECNYSHHQYKLVLDTLSDKLALVSEAMTTDHSMCLQRPA